MSDVVNWSPVDADNKHTWPENTLKIKDLNNAGRADEGAFRRYMNDAQWLPLGRLTGPAVVTVVSETVLSFPSADIRGTYAVGRMIRVQGAQTGTITGWIKASQYTNGGNMVLTIDWKGTGKMVVETGLQMWLHIIGPDWLPRFNGFAGEIWLTADGSQKLRMDTSGLQVFVGGDVASSTRKPVALFASDGLLIGKITRGLRAVGAWLSTSGALQLVAGSGAPLFVAREVASTSTLPADRAVRMITVIQNGEEQNGGLNTTGNGNIHWYDGVPK